MKTCTIVIYLKILSLFLQKDKEEKHKQKDDTSPKQFWDAWFEYDIHVCLCTYVYVHYEHIQTMSMYNISPNKTLNKAYIIKCQNDILFNKKMIVLNKTLIFFYNFINLVSSFYFQVIFTWYVSSLLWKMLI